MSLLMWGNRTHVCSKKAWIRCWCHFDMPWRSFLPQDKSILSWKIILASLKLKSKASEGIAWISTWNRKPFYFSLLLNREWPILLLCFRVLFILYRLASIHFSQFLVLILLRTNVGGEESCKEWALSHRCTEDKLLISVSDSILPRMKLIWLRSFFWIY